MRKKIRAARAAAWLLGGATLAVSGRASAAGNCSALTNPVYVSGSSAVKPLLQAVANVLGSSVSIVYQNPGSCEGLGDILKPAMDTLTPILIVPGAANDTCTLPGAGATIDIGFSDVYLKTCHDNYDSTLPTSLSSTQADFLGPVQAMTIAVPVDSTANNISAEAAYMVFGFAAATGKQIMPWTDPTQIFVRYYDSGTLEMIATAIGLPGSKWVHATDNPNSPPAGSTVKGGTGPMQNAIAAAEGVMADQSTAIGILSTSGLNPTGANAGKIKPLAFQGKDQLCSYYPDSGMTAGDKINVRQGRYQIWGPEHMITNVDGSGKPVGKNSNTAAVQTLINALISTSQALPAASDAGTPEGGTPEGGGVTTLGETEVGNIIAAISTPSNGFIPQCAMQVSRTTEIGAEASYAPPAACTCAYEAAAGSSPGSNCATRACTTDADCTGKAGTPVCHFKFCEAE
jgi:ABC-type phosphate transport system substrate-binding protein